MRIAGAPRSSVRGEAVYTAIVSPYRYVSPDAGDDVPSVSVIVGTVSVNFNTTVSPSDQLRPELVQVALASTTVASAKANNVPGDLQRQGLGGSCQGGIEVDLQRSVREANDPA